MRFMILGALCMVGTVTCASAASSATYTYDSQGRLATATYLGASTTTVTYSYDAAGNRTSVVSH